jgi:plastocyanin
MPLRRATRLTPLLLLAALASLALLAAGAGEARADTAQVTVVSLDGKELALPLEALAGDVVDGTYALRSTNGESRQTVTGFSLGKILEAAGADTFGFSYLDVQRPGGGAVRLSRHQALDPVAFDEGPPVVYATAAGAGFIRPSSGPEDLNAGECFEARGLRIVLHEGPQLRAKATATPLQVKPGEKVEFSATVKGVGSGEQVSYSWTFGDGQRLTDAGAEVSHSFAEPGSYSVLVGVTAPGNETGTAAVVRVQVGQPSQGGPDREGGGSNRAKGAPDQGAAEGPAGGTGSDSGSAAAIPPPAASFAEPAPAPAAETQPPVEPEPVPEPAGKEVSGLLISGTATAPEAAAPEEQAAARTGTPSDEDGGGLPTAAWGILAAAGLLGVGALLEAGALGGVARLRGRTAP